MACQGTTPDAGEPAPNRSGGVQSVQRALDLLEILASHDRGLPVVEAASTSGLPMPTTHRLLRTLVERGYVRQLPGRNYALGFRLVPLGAAASAAIGGNAQALLTGLVSELGETANLAILSGSKAEYVGQAPSQYNMRMFTEVGRRVDLHATGVGKALLAQLDEDDVSNLVRSQGLPPHTEHTITTGTGLLAALVRIRAAGYALDEQEQELGVRCVAVPVHLGPSSGMAISVSGPMTRMSDAFIRKAVPMLQTAARQLARDLVGSP